MSDSLFRPVAIVVDIENRLLQINWTDGHTSIYSLDLLRRACPCAECQPWIHGETGRPVIEPARRARGALRSSSDVHMVGTYAIEFDWEDGHNAGIYSFEYLRSLCPCGEHGAVRGEKT